MKLAILSDIHSNCFALKSVIDEFEKHDVSDVIVAGDIFGYYPWACETYELLLPYIPTGIFVKGNHDQLLLDSFPPDPEPSYWPAAKQNEKSLLSKYPEAISWLKKLEYTTQFRAGSEKITVVHGTPSDQATGRFYPDNPETHAWLPRNGELLIMGHTHYPLYKTNANGGTIINPGSVGQPRDGNPMPSWGILDSENLIFQPLRTHYDNLGVMKNLEAMNWEERSVRALNKTQKGKL